MRAALRWISWEATSFARWLPAMILAVLLVLVPAGIAEAATSSAAATTASFPIPGICGGKDSPAPARPDSGAVSWFTHRPDPLPAQADPFAANPTTTIYEQYGLAGMTFHTYDLGCISDVPAQASNGVANWIMGIPKVIFALTAAISSATLKPTWLSAFDGPLTAVTSILQAAVFSPFGPLLLIIACATILWGALRMRIGKALGALGMTLVALTFVAIAVNYPIKAGSLADRTVIGAITGINSQINGVDSGGNSVDPAARNMSALYSTILYKQWLAGELGSSDSATARKYGPDLLRASALTWAETAIVDAAADSPALAPTPGPNPLDPTPSPVLGPRANPHAAAQSAATKIIEGKQALWESTANKIKNSDPDAYEYLRGTRDAGVDRVMSAGLAAASSFLLLPFLMISYLLMLACFIVIRLLVMLAPLIGAAALLPQMHGMLRTVAEIAAASIINTIVFAAGTSVVIVAAGGVLSSSTVPPWLGLVLVTILCFAMWIILRPFRRLTRLATGSDPLRDMANSGPSMVTKIKHLVGMAAASAAGNYAADVIEGKDRPESYTRPEAITSVADPDVAQPPPVRPYPAVTVGTSYEMPAGTGGPTNGAAAEPVLLTVTPQPTPHTYAPMVTADGARYALPQDSGGSHRAISQYPGPAAIEPGPDYSPSTGAQPTADPVLVDDGATLPEPVEKGYDDDGAPVWVIYSPSEGFHGSPVEQENDLGLER